MTSRIRVGSAAGAILLVLALVASAPPMEDEQETAALALLAPASFGATRIAPRDVLESGTRARIREVVRSRGPMSLSILAREVGLDRTTVEHHVRILGRAALLQATHLAGRLVVHLPGQDPARSLARGASSVEARILALLAASGGWLPRAEVHVRLAGVARRSRCASMLRLQVAGAVKREWAGRVEILRLVAPHGPAGPVGPSAAAVPPPPEGASLAAQL